MSKILLAHGGGGKMMQRLIEDTILPPLNNSLLSELSDSALINLKGQSLAFTTDSYVIDPIFFRGGDIGRLAVCGTVNDLAVSGAKPLYLSLAFIIEEGFPQSDLKKIMASIAKTAKEAGVKIVTGDTKVVGKGSADKIFINTAGIGMVISNRLSACRPARQVIGKTVKPGDQIIVSGTIGDHGIAVLSQREGLKFETKLKSDVAPLNHLVTSMLKASKNIRVMRDPTRGGVATALNDFAKKYKVGIEIDETKIPLKREVRAACEMLGLDPLYVANEGKLIAIVAKKDTPKVLSAMRKTKYGKQAKIIGEVTKEHPKKVLLRTLIGGRRIVDTFLGEQLPRIC
jgi:hydrogenase expression/formation protein HypE